MPTLLEGLQRPDGMARGDRTAQDPTFDANEPLYRRIDPEFIEVIEPGKYRVIPRGWTDVIEMSVVRGKYAPADHARWDSATDERNPPEFQPKLYRDWWVSRILRGDIPASISSAGGSECTLEPVHVPFDDLYAHTEVHTKKNGVKLKRSGDFKARNEYRTLLTHRAVLVLKPGQIDETPPPPAGV